MPLYDYKCLEHGHFEKNQPMAQHNGAYCPECKVYCHQVIVRAPSLDYDRMGNDPDLPTAWDRKGDRITKRHRDAGQSHRKGRWD